MSARPVLMRPGNGRMVHLAGVLDSNTQEFLRPAVATIATAGMPQSVVHIRNDRDSPLVFPDSVDVLTVDRRDANRMRSWRSLLEVFLGVVGQGGVYAVHLHGFAAGLLGARALSTLGGGTRVYYSPHRWPNGGLPGAGRIASYALGVLGMRLPLYPIASNVEQARTLEHFIPGATKVVENEVAETYFLVRHSEAARPLVVTDGRGQSSRDANRFGQLAVLLGGEHLDIGFQWLGPTTNRFAAPLAAAGIDAVQCYSDIEVAARLACGWIYAYPGRGDGHPLAVPNAMAVGLPCVVMDTPRHRRLISHGVNGFLCRRHEDLLQFIALLVDHPLLRSQFGRAASEEAEQRFGSRRFRSALLEAYGIPEREPEAVISLTQM